MHMCMHMHVIHNAYISSDIHEHAYICYIFSASAKSWSIKHALIGASLVVRSAVTTAGCSSCKGGTGLGG